MTSARTTGSTVTPSSQARVLKRSIIRTDSACRRHLGAVRAPVANGSRRLPAERAIRQAGRRYWYEWVSAPWHHRRRPAASGRGRPASARVAPNTLTIVVRAADRKEDVPEMRLARPSLTAISALLACFVV